MAYLLRKCRCFMFKKFIWFCIGIIGSAILLYSCLLQVEQPKALASVNEHLVHISYKPHMEENIGFYYYDPFTGEFAYKVHGLSESTNGVYFLKKFDGVYRVYMEERGVISNELPFDKE